METEINKIVKDTYAVLDSIPLSGYWWQVRPHRWWQKHSPAQVIEIDEGSRIERCACGAMRPITPHFPLRLSGWIFGSDQRRTIRKWKRDQNGNNC